MHVLSDYTLEPKFHFYFQNIVVNLQQIIRNRKEMLYFLYIFNTVIHFIKVLDFVWLQDLFFLYSYFS